MRKKDYLEELKELISIMNGAEKRLFSKQLNAYYLNLKANEKKMFKLFTLLCKKKQFSYDDLKQKVSKNSSDDSFKRLIRRLSYKIEESLILEPNINRGSTYSQIFKARYRAKKQLIQAHILKSRGLVLKAVNLNVRTIRDTKKYELFDELIEATSMLLTSNIARNNIKKADQLKSDLEVYLRQRQTLEQIRFIINEYDSLINIKSNRSFITEFLSSAVSRIEELIQIQSSVNAISYLYLLKLELYDITNDVKAFIETGELMIELLTNEPAIYSKNRIIYLNNKVSKSNLLLFQFEQAEKKAEQALSLSGATVNNNYLTAIESKFQAVFFQSDYKRAMTILKDVFQLSILKKYGYRKSIFSYYEAVTHFLLGDYKGAQLSLNELVEIEKDKEGWNVWIRLLQLLIFVELKKFDLLDYEIENFRKYLQRAELTKKSSGREELILNILIDLNRRNYNFKEVAARKKDDLLILEQNEKYKWKINTPELIQFHVWFVSKLKEENYSPIFK